MLRNAHFSVGTIIASLSFFAFSSLVVLIPLYIQSCRGYTATISGLVMLPGAIAQAIAQFFGGRALDRFGARPVAMVGTILLCLGTTMMSMIGMGTWIWYISICQFIRQIGMGFVMMPVTTWSLNCLKPTEVSAGSAVTNTVRQIAGAIGSPVMILIMYSIAAAQMGAGRPDIEAPVTTWSLNCLKPTEVSAGSAVTNTVRQIAGAIGSPVMILIMYSIAAAQMGAGRPDIEANVIGIEWALRISAIINFIMILMVVFGVRGEDAGSARSAVRRALRHAKAASAQ